MPIILASVGGSKCIVCARLQSELEASVARNRVLEAELERSKNQLKELTKLTTLQGEDLKRLKEFIKNQPERNQPERVKEDVLQLAFTEILSANKDNETLTAAIEEARGSSDEQQSGSGPESDNSGADEENKKKKKKGGGRRKLSLAGLPIVEERIVPKEVEACGGEGWVLVGEEISERLGFQRAQFKCVRVVREKWARVSPRGLWLPHTMVTAPQPDWVLPRLMADTSAIASILIGKYGFAQPLHRQEQISRLHGFSIARSTMSDWTEAAYKLAAPVVKAMHTEGVRESYVTATDATGAPVRVAGGQARWHMFVFVFDAGHITFMPTRRHNGTSIRTMLEGFRGHLLSDASSIYNALHVLGVVPLACWAHLRRYFWKATVTDPHLAYQALAFIKCIFDIVRKAKQLPETQRGRYRTQHAGPIVKALDAWVGDVRSKIDTGGALQAALTYYSNQKKALSRFLEDPRFDVHNNACERELRGLVMGLNNWQHFETSAGLEWFTTFRTLISSCRLHGLNPYDYLEQMLRLVRHWPEERALDLSPKYWPATLEQLDQRQRAILEPSWQKHSGLSPPGPTNAKKAA